MGNPRRKPGKHSPAETRFKMWWDLIGSAVEHAASLVVGEVEACIADAHPACPAERVRFKELFRGAESEDTQTESTITVLETLLRLWPTGFYASDVANWMSDANEVTLASKAALAGADDQQRDIPVISSTVLSWRLKALKDRPVTIDDGKHMLVLRHDQRHEGALFQVVRKPMSETPETETEPNQ
jgi:hypothetical protein